MIDKPLPKVAEFKGLNNRIDPTSLGLQWQIQADNVLLDNAGHLIRRPGYASFLTDVADAYGTRDGRMFVVTTGGSLYEVQSTGSYRLRAVGFSGSSFVWTELGYATWAMSETTAWVIYPNRAAAWGIPTLGAPTVVTAAGTLTPGEYIVVCILEASDGRLGGCSGVTRIDVSSGQGLSISSPVYSGYTTRVYLSRPDGADLYLAGELSSGILWIASDPTLGARLATQNLYPPPRGSVIGSVGNRLVVGVWEPELDRSVLYYSRPNMPHLFDLSIDYQLIPGKITLLAGLNNSLLIGTDRALWIETHGSPVQVAARFGVYPNTLCWRDLNTIAFWTDRGLCTYPPLALPTDTALSPDNRSLTSAGLLYYGGSEYYVCAQRGEIRPHPQHDVYDLISLDAPVYGESKVNPSATGTLTE